MTSYALDDTGRRLVEENINLVPYIINRCFRSLDWEFDDLVSIGNIAICQAAATYKQDRGIKFTTYASNCIVNNIRKELISRNTQRHSGDLYLISLNEKIDQSDYSEDSCELIDLIEDPSVDVEKQVMDQMLFDIARNYTPTFMEMQELQMDVREYARKKRCTRQDVNFRLNKELDLARKALC